MYLNISLFCFSNFLRGWGRVESTKLAHREIANIVTKFIRFKFFKCYLTSLLCQDKGGRHHVLKYNDLVPEQLLTL